MEGEKEREVVEELGGSQQVRGPPKRWFGFRRYFVWVAAIGAGVLAVKSKQLISYR